MEVAGTIISEAVQEIDDADENESATVSYFAARQPGIVRYLAGRLGEHSDAMAVGLYYSCAIYAAYERTVGLPPPRVAGSLLDRAERAFLAEASMPGQVLDGLSQRQPALAQWVADVVESPPVPLDEQEAARVGMALATVVYALDEASWGRSVP